MLNTWLDLWRQAVDLCLMMIILCYELQAQQLSHPVSCGCRTFDVWLGAAAGMLEKDEEASVSLPLSVS